MQINFGFIVCYDIDNVHIEVISIQKLINIDRRKLVEILLSILKEVIDRFIWTIELCHIWNLFKHFFNRTLFLATTNAIIYSSTFFTDNHHKSKNKNAKVRVERSPIFKDRFFYNMEIFWEMVWIKLFNV
jgi:hypothetical protein